MNFSNLLQQIKKHQIKWIRLQFCNPFGLLHQISIPVDELTKESLVNGFPLDGSSIVGFSNIEDSDIILIPDISTFTIIPDFFDVDNRELNQYQSKAARMLYLFIMDMDKGNFLVTLGSLHTKLKNFLKNQVLIKHTGLLS